MTKKRLRLWWRVDKSSVHSWLCNLHLHSFKGMTSVNIYSSSTGAWMPHNDTRMSGENNEDVNVIRESNDWCRGLQTLTPSFHVSNVVSCRLCLAVSYDIGCLMLPSCKLTTKLNRVGLCRARTISVYILIHSHPFLVQALLYCVVVLRLPNILVRSNWSWDIRLS